MTAIPRTAGESAPKGYSAPARWFHWVTALIVLILIPAGITMTNLPDGPTKDAIYEWHKSFGMVVWIIAVLRIVYRLAAGAPPPDPSLTPFQRVASHAGHMLLYALVFLLPILGYAGTVMCCAPVNLFFTWPVPITLTGSEATVKTIFWLHETGGLILAVLVIGHICAALYHGLIRRDGVLARMLPGGGG
jgi:cytochrome b561